jgi:hypothetical protein
MIHLLSHDPSTSVDFKSSNFEGNNNNAFPIIKTEGTFGKFSTGLVSTSKTNYIQHNGANRLVVRWANNHNDPTEGPLVVNGADSLERGTGLKFM